MMCWFRLACQTSSNTTLVIIFIFTQVKCVYLPTFPGQMFILKSSYRLTFRFLISARTFVVHCSNFFFFHKPPPRLLRISECRRPVNGIAFTSGNFTFLFALEVEMEKFFHFKYRLPIMIRMIRILGVGGRLKTVNKWD